MADQQDVPLSSIRPDPRNPRHDPAKDQREAIHQMVENQDEKLLRLAEDIVENGLNPSELLIVIPDPDGPESGSGRQYIALEGNRRLTALKLLEHPDLLPSSASSSVRKKYSDLGKVYSKNPIQSLPCVVFPGRDAANRWIQLRHTGENQGIGIVSWGAKEQERFRADLGAQSPTLKIMDYMRERGGLSASVKAKLGDISITNLERLVNDPEVRKVLGIEIKQGAVTATLPEKEVTKGLRRIISDLATEAINVNHIRTKADREKYLKGFSSADVPDASKGVSPWPVESGTAGPGPSPSSPSPNVAKRALPLASARAVLIPRQCVIAIADTRINAIYKELQRIKVADFPNAAAIMLRVFFELSVDHYHSTKGLPPPKKDILKSKVHIIVEHMETTKILTKDALKPVKVAMTHPDELFSIDTLHAFVHNNSFHPSAQELKTIWDRMERFMGALWS